jgi:membrane protein
MTGPALRVVREVAREVVRHVRRHDLVFYAAGLTFYAAIAVVPLLLVAWFVTSLVLGQELVRALTLALAEYAPTSLGLQEGVRSLGEVGPRLGITALAAALVPATSYGDGLVRALDRVAERDRRAKGLRGRLLALVFVAALPPVVMAELGAVAVLPGALGFTGRFSLASVAVAFAVGWPSASLLVGVLYRAFTPRPIRAGALALGAALTGSFLAGMSLTWLFLLRFGVDVGIAFGDSDLLGTVVVAAVYLYLVQVVLLGGYVLSLVLARTMPGSGGPSALADDVHHQVVAVPGRVDPEDHRAASLQPPVPGAGKLQPAVEPLVESDRPAGGGRRDPAPHLLTQLARAVAARPGHVLQGRAKLAGAVEEVLGRAGRCAEDHHPVPRLVQGSADAATAAAARVGHRPAGTRRDVEPQPGRPAGPAQPVEQPLHAVGQDRGWEAVGVGFEGQDRPLQLGHPAQGGRVARRQRLQGPSLADRLVTAGEDGHGAGEGAGDQRRDRLAGLPEGLGAGVDRGPVARPDDHHRAPHGRVPVAADAAGGQLLRLVQELGRGQRAAEQEQGRHGQQQQPPGPAPAGRGGIGDGRLDGVPEPLDEGDRAHRATSSSRARRARPRWTRPLAVLSLHPSRAAIVW